MRGPGGFFFVKTSESIIDRLIDACLEAGIDEIYIVRGYLAEQFDQLLYKYPMVKFLENPLYNEADGRRLAQDIADVYAMLGGIFYGKQRSPQPAKAEIA